MEKTEERKEREREREREREEKDDIIERTERQGGTESVREGEGKRERERERTCLDSKSRECKNSSPVVVSSPFQYLNLH